MKLALLLLAVWTPRIVHPVKDEATHEMLRAVAQENDRVERAEATAALQFIADPSTTNIAWALPVVDTTNWSAEETLQNLHAPDVLTQEAAVRHVGTVQLTNAVPVLVELLDDDDEGLRQTVCAALAALRDPASAAAVGKRLEVEESARVRRAAVDVLLALHTDGARAELLRLLSHDRWQAREAAARGIGEWGDTELAEPLHPLLDDPVTEVQVAAAIALTKLRNPVSETPLLARLPNAPAVVQVPIVDALGELRSAAVVSYCVDWVKGTNDALGRASAEALGKIKDERVIPALRHVIYHVDSVQGKTRLAALRLLRELGDDGLAERMVQFVTDQVVPPPPGGSLPMYDSVAARSEALHYLVRYGNRSHGESMLRKFKDPAPAELRPLLAETLTHLLGTPYRPLPDQDYRRYTVESLGPAPFTYSPPVPGVVTE